MTLRDELAEIGEQIANQQGNSDEWLAMLAIWLPVIERRIAQAEAAVAQKLSKYQYTQADVDNRVLMAEVAAHRTGYEEGRSFADRGLLEELERLRHLTGGLQRQVDHLQERLASAVTGEACLACEREARLCSALDTLRHEFHGLHTESPFIFQAIENCTHQVCREVRNVLS